MGTWTNHEPRRIRKLLLHRKEIDRLAADDRRAGLTLVPLSLYFKDGKPRSSWRWPAVSGPTTSGRNWPDGTLPGRSSVPCGAEGSGVRDHGPHT